MPDSITAPARPRLATARRGPAGIPRRLHRAPRADVRRIARAHDTSAVRDADDDSGDRHRPGAACFASICWSTMCAPRPAPGAAPSSCRCTSSRTCKLAKAEQLASALRQRSGIASVNVIAADEALEGISRVLGLRARRSMRSRTIRCRTRSSFARRRSRRFAVAHRRAAPLSAELAGSGPGAGRHGVGGAAAIDSRCRATRCCCLAAVLLGAGVIVIVGNTIRLDIENRRTEIEVTKLVGGSDAFVRRPFLYSGFWYGLGGSLLAWGLVSLGIHLAGSTSESTGWTLRQQLQAWSALIRA